MKSTKFDLWKVLHPGFDSGCAFCKHWRKYDICGTLGNQECDLFLKEEKDITEEEWEKTFPQREKQYKNIFTISDED